MKAIITIVTFFMSATVLASGFKCHTTNGDLDIAVYNHTQPSEGTRNAAIMVISDPSVKAGNKTVARFTDAENTLGRTGTKYFANVDERFNNIPKGEYLSGTRIDYLQTIILDIEFDYADVLAADEITEGWLILVRENGSQIKRKVMCSRYLKH